MTKMELRDQNGRTEAEFLAQYRPGKYERPSVTADILVFACAEGTKKLLLVRRKGHPYLGCWATPGGFANKNETLDAAAARELEEETHVRGLVLEPLGVFSDPGRDPRGWVISEAFVTAAEEKTLRVQADDDAADAAWFTVEESRKNDRLSLKLWNEKAVLTAELRILPQQTPFGVRKTYEILSSQGLAFDHAKLIAAALDRFPQSRKE